MHDVLRKVQAEISTLSYEVLITAQTNDDLVQSLYDQHQIELPHLKRDEAVHDHFQYYLSRYVNPGPQKHQDVTQGTVFCVEVPFVGDKKYFDLRPDAYDNAIPQGHVEDQRLTLYVAAKNLTPDAVQAKFEQALDAVERYLGWQTATLRDLPTNFQQTANAAIAARLQRLNNDRAISSALKYPLKTRVNAPTVSIPLVRKQIRPMPISSASPSRKSHAFLAEEHYLHILAVIENMARAMEYSPKAFASMDEEAIRFAMLIQLNAQYESSATGETFNYQGKSDILIREQNTNLFVAECKVWNGSSALSDAIDQLQRYVTWRDTKTALIVFNRNKGFSSVIQQAQRVLVKHPQFKSGPTQQSETRFRYVFKNLTDQDREYSLTLLLFDVPVPGP